MTKAVIFDLWNTLAYNDVKVNPVIQMENLLGIKFRDYKETERAFMAKRYKSKQEAALMLCKSLGIKPTEELIEKIIKIWNITTVKFALFPDVVPALKEVRKMGYKTGLISNTDCFSIEGIYQNSFDKYFDAMTFSCEINILKPDKRIFLDLLKKLDADPKDTVLIGDNLKEDILPAESLGMKCILIKRKGPYSLSWVETGTYKNEINTLEEIWKYL